MLKLRNLAGIQNADDYVSAELYMVDVPAVKAEVRRTEVSYTLWGQLGPFRFVRAWSYYVVSGMVPIEIARVMYDHPIGRASVRVDGFGGNTEPKEPFAIWVAPDGRRVMPASEMAAELEKPLFVNSPAATAAVHRDFVADDDPASAGAVFGVNCYHIDDLEGLKYFVDTIRGHGLVGTPLADLTPSS